MKEKMMIFMNFMGMILGQIKQIVKQLGGAIIQDDRVEKYTEHYRNHSNNRLRLKKMNH